MLDIKYIRENPEFVKTSTVNKNENVDIDALLVLDEQKRKVQFEFDELRANQNKVSKEIAQLKKSKADASSALSEMQEVAGKVKTLSAELSNLESRFHQQLLTVPNIPLEEVPIGKDESSNEYIREWGTPKTFNFKPKNQVELCDDLVDLKRGAKITGSGFPVYVGDGALLEHALIQFMRYMQIERHGYTELVVPHIVNRKAMTGTGQLPKMEDDMYHINEEDLFLIPTGEVPVTNFYAGEILRHVQLPVKLTTVTPCFRREAGSYGKDTKGLQRVHQFNKMEIVRLVEPQYSAGALLEMVGEAEAVLQALGLHYRVAKLATGDLSFASAITYDLEVWAPASEKFLEVSSVSNFLDFQARRSSIRYRKPESKPEFVHTLNGSGLATPRTFIALI
ncbi:MAG: serine--tRNA ligase, partial [Candidatus Cloacimonetes bacterium]|nr:serine--tRNA ligase [Candidatus Cloacimonadota bacterium]